MRRAPSDAFGRAAHDYELGRPEWPVEVVERALAELALGPSAEVLDLAAGTRKLTRILVRRVGRVLAVEPDDEMRAPRAERPRGRGARGNRGTNSAARRVRRRRLRR